MKQLVAVVGVGLIAALSSASAEGQSRRNATRVDFEDVLIKGQTNQGAVHLIERKDSNLGSLIRTRRNFRQHILLPYGYEAESGLTRDDALEEEELVGLTGRSASAVSLAPDPGLLKPVRKAHTEKAAKPVTGPKKASKGTKASKRASAKAVPKKVKRKPAARTRKSGSAKRGKKR